MYEKALSNCVLAKVSMDDITDAEKRMGVKFPESLRKFYQEYGYGFVNNKWRAINKLLAPGNCADIRLREDVYENDDVLDDIWGDCEAEEWTLIFFEVYPQRYLSIGFDDAKIYAVGPGIYEAYPIADSLEEFLERIVNPEYWVDPDYREYCFDDDEDYDDDYDEDEDYDDDDYDEDEDE